MDAEQFSPFKTGHLVPINTIAGQDHAFVPDDLPPKWVMADRLWPLLVEARDRVARLDGIGRTLPHPRLLLQPLQRREAIHSSSLEGTYATPSQLMLFELEREGGRRSPRTGAAEDASPNRLNAWLEVWNYYTAMRSGHERLARGGPLTTDLLRRLHGMLMKGVRGKDRHPGRFRECQVFVGRNRRYVPPPPETLGKALDALVGFLAQETSDLDPLVRAFCVHYQFEAIHPFIDGNGRVGRLLLSLSIGRWLRLSYPWLYLSAYFERHRDEYIRRLFRVSTHGEWDEWIEFCLTGTINQAEDAARRCAAFQAIRAEYVTSVGRGSSRMHDILDMLLDKPMVRIVDVQRMLGVSYPTAKTDVQRLLAAGILEPVEGSYPRAFIAPEVVEIAYGDADAS